MLTKKDVGWRQCSFQLYFTMKATASLLLFSAEQASLSDKKSVEFIRWAQSHAEEEKEHYKWYLDDLEAIGFKRYEIENTIPDGQILNLLGAQFALAATVDPVSVLGYFYAMECHPGDPSAIRERARKLSIPAEGLRTILYHTEVDKEHKKEIIELVNLYATHPLSFRAMLTSGVNALIGWTELFRKFTTESGVVSK